MNIVPENINEAIKHLKPRSKEEVDKIREQVLKEIRKASDEELYDMWYDKWNLNNYSHVDDILFYKELKRRKVDYFVNRIEVSEWFEIFRDELNESIKHLTPRPAEEVKEFEECEELLRRWINTYDHNKEVEIYKELKHRNANVQLDMIESCYWFHDYCRGKFS